MFTMFREYFIGILYMSDWIKYLQTQLKVNPGKPLKDVIEIAKINIILIIFFELIKFKLILRCRLT